MSVIRTNLPPPAPAAQAPRLDPAKLAAQRAFFAQAMGQPAPAASPAPEAVKPAPEPSRGAAASPAEAPARILRPGSLLDIRV